jgi:hypothetical protein
MSRIVFGLALLLAAPAFAGNVVLQDDLGTGVDLRFDPIEARATCVDGYTIATSQLNMDFRFLEVSGSTELQTKLSATMGVALTQKLTASSSFAGSFDLGVTDSYTAFVLEVNTVSRNFAQENTDGVNAVCTADAPTDYDDFLDQCGTHWLKAESLGGYIVVLVRGTTLTSQLEAEYEMEGSLPLTEEIGVNTNATARLFEQLQIGAVDATVTLVGLPPLSLGKVESTDIVGLDSSDVGAYVNELYASVHKGLNGPDRNERLPAYGLPLQQHLQTSTGLMRSCGVEIPPEVEEQLICADDAFEAYEASKTSELEKVGRALLDLDFLDAILDDAAHWDWGTDPDVTKDEYRAAAEHIAYCRDEVIPKVSESCAVTHRVGDFENLCDVCEIPDAATLGAALGGCTERELDALAKNLTPVRPYAPGAPHTSVHNTIQSGTIYTLGSLEQDVCLLTGVSGRFEGGGEKVLLQPTAGSWRMQVSSKRSASNERLRAETTCVEKHAFIDLNGRPKWLDESGHHGLQGTSFPDLTHGLTLAGLQGKLDDDGDVAQVLPGAPHGEVRRAGGITNAWGTAFGVMDPANGTAAVRHYTVSSNDVPKKNTNVTTMANADAAVCHLSSVSGDFDGDGESAKVVQGGVNWELKVTAACTDHEGWFGSGDCIERKPVVATASCMFYHQD